MSELIPMALQDFVVDGTNEKVRRLGHAEAEELKAGDVVAVKGGDNGYKITHLLVIGRVVTGDEIGKMWRPEEKRAPVFGVGSIIKVKGAEYRVTRITDTGFEGELVAASDGGGSL